MALNLKKVCDELNDLSTLPLDLEFVVNFVDQSIFLRKKVKFPIMVATRSQIEDNLQTDLALAAIDYAAGTSASFDPSEVVEQKFPSCQICGERL